MSQNDQLRCIPCRKRFPNKVLLENHLERTHKRIFSDVFVPNESDSSAEDDSFYNHQANAISANHALPTYENEGNDFQTPSVEVLTCEAGASQHDTLSNSSNAENISLLHNHKEDERSELNSNDSPLFEFRNPTNDVGDAAVECWSFFNALGDSSEPVFPDLSDKPLAFEELPVPLKAMLEYCTENHLTVGESKKLYRLVTVLEGGIPEEFRKITCRFHTAEQFSTYLVRLRRSQVVAEGWRKAVINSEIGLNKTGVFRPVLPLLRELLEDVGGADAVLPFQAEFREEKRVFSSPHNSNAMMEYQNAVGGNGKVLLIDVYSDSTTLSSSGTQSAHPFRVRFSNIKGLTKVWHEVGIMPSIPDSAREISSEAKIRRAKNELWHRFAFLALEGVMKHSHTGLFVQGEKLYPRLGMMVFDQVQERPSCGLKGHGGYHDCTHCLIPTRRKPLREESKSATLKKRLHPEPEQGLRGHRGRKVGRTKTHSDVTLRPRQKCSSDLDLQLEPLRHPSRSVYRTVMAQLCVAKRRGSSHTSSALYKTTMQRFDKAMKYLLGVSALDFPPALASFGGAGSFPYRLYASVTFDMLHVVEHGIMRQIADDAHKVFEIALEYSGLSSSAVCNIANMRIMELPAFCNLRRFEPFRKNADEKQAGVTGKMRREVNPFLWYSVMGISRSRRPDDDRYLQLLLKLDFLYRKMVGINQSVEQRKRSAKEIKELGHMAFAVGKELALLLNANMNTKIHRTMFHIPDHLFDFGCIRKGATDGNETMHKNTKQSYNSTNKQMSKLAPQLLSARAVLQSDAADDPICSSVERILITRKPLVMEASDKLENHTTPTWLIDHIALPQTESHLWTQISSVRFPASFEWCTETVWETAYGGESVRKRNYRRDGIVYGDRCACQYGIIQSLYVLKQNTKEKLALIRKLYSVPGEDGNQKVVETYGNKRFQYKIRDGNVEIDLIPVRSFLRKAILLPDPWVIVRELGYNARVSAVPDTVESRKKQSFFEVAGYKHTSFNEQE